MAAGEKGRVPTLQGTFWDQRGVGSIGKLSVSRGVEEKMIEGNLSNGEKSTKTMVHDLQKVRPKS